ncbi:hypothetical protein [Phocoenobacter uteri]|uniref:hypothetical protein n=1 Tax=Phocoenobacter uteri TaxID=146806 RepID=UPI000E1B831B|nr:hypothetical protein [Phocoenobacter uteri]MDG6880984.1 hypothetical protein [Phocoenobacter uteri]
MSSELILNDNKKYIVMYWMQGFREWHILSESRCGVSKSEALSIRDYNIKMCKKNPAYILVTEVPIV